MSRLHRLPLNHSTLTFDSESTSWAQSLARVESNTTSTSMSSDRTVQGLGIVSGRMIYAVGEVVLRGADNMAILNRLRTIKSLFPHDTNSLSERNTPRFIDNLYDDALELTRPVAYKHQVRKPVMKALLIQIGTRQTRHLVRCLAKWHTGELVLFLAEMMACMPENWVPPETEFRDWHQELLGEYVECQNLEPEDHYGSPMLDFMLRLARESFKTSQAVLEAGFLDILLCMYICDFHYETGVHSSVAGEMMKREMMKQTCTDMLVELSKYPENVAVISGHPIFDLWPRGQLFDSQMTRRARNSKIWRHVDMRPLVSRRLGVLFRDAKRRHYITEPNAAELAEACMDLIEFSSPDEYGITISEIALACTQMHDEFSEARINDTLSSLSSADSVAFIARMRLWLSRNPSAMRQTVSTAQQVYQIFGVPLETSLKRASIQISTANELGELSVWGNIPLVIAKCGLRLKDMATRTQRIFSERGSQAHVKKLQAEFEKAPQLGKLLDWDMEDYTAHDVADVFLGYLRRLPDTIVPHDMQRFFLDAFTMSASVEERVTKYLELIPLMPRANQCLLLYILDILQVFARRSDENVMSLVDLSSVFGSVLISSSVDAYNRNLPQEVTEFLVLQEAHFHKISPMQEYNNTGDGDIVIDA